MVDSVNQVSLTDAHFESIARLYSTEVNFRKPLFGNLSVLAGFRWLEMTDKYLADGNVRHHGEHRVRNDPDA